MSEHCECTHGYDLYNLDEPNKIFAVHPECPQHSPESVRVDAIRESLSKVTPGEWSLEYDNADDYEAGINAGDYPYAINGPKCAYQDGPEEYRNHITEISDLRDEDAEFLARAKGRIEFLLGLLDRNYIPATTAKKDHD